MKDNIDSLKEVQEKYDGMNENQLTGELLKTVAAAKQNGNFNYNEMLTFANTMFPYLTDEQRSKLVELLKIIKK